MATQSLHSGFILYLINPSAQGCMKPKNILTLLMVGNDFSVFILTTQNVPDFLESLSKPPGCAGRKVLQKLQTHVQQ